ncbi:hypothetical protein [Nostoc sp.]|uniref:hypothetical protein n=1 Tax=Nostoc sp. TaxID=1180 RepID=UPI002FFB2012
MVQQKPRSVDSKSRGWWINITICLVTSIYQSVGRRHKIALILLSKVRRGKEKHPLNFPTPTANFLTSFHIATNVAQWHKILTLSASLDTLDSWF